ncbi:MAG: ABC transporter substrate-binding protein [Motiliproteus sp.]
MNSNLNAKLSQILIQASTKARRFFLATLTGVLSLSLSLTLSLTLSLPVWLLGLDQSRADQLPQISVAALKFGTLNWELETIRRQQFDRAHGYQLDVTPLAGMSATRTALMSGSSDVIVADWIWVSRQRAAGQMLQFIPFSTAIGELILARDSSIQSLADLDGKRIGIAGGPASKGWLLLRARAMQQGIDLAATTEQQYGAPPLLNAALEAGRIDAVLTFWHFAARLKAQGLTSLLNLKQTSRELGLESDLPMLGFVFRQQWAEQNPQLVAGLLHSSQAAKQLLLRDAEAWGPLRGMMKASADETFIELKQGYLDGIPAPLTDAQIDDAVKMYALMHQVGGSRLLGESATLDRASFRVIP